MGILGEPSTPNDPSQGLVWSAIVRQVDLPGSQGEFVSVANSPREQFHKHPWSIGGGGAAELKDRLDGEPEGTLGHIVASIGFFQDTHADDAFVQPNGFGNRRKVAHGFRAQVRGDNIRHWAVITDEEILFPYDKNLVQWKEIPPKPAWIWLYMLRTELWSRSTFGRRTYRTEGRPWFDYHQFPKSVPHTKVDRIRRGSHTQSLCVRTRREGVQSNLAGDQTLTRCLRRGPHCPAGTS